MHLLDHDTATARAEDPANRLRIGDTRQIADGMRARPRAEVAPFFAALEELDAEALAALHARPRPSSEPIKRRQLRANRAKLWKEITPPLFKHTDWSHPGLLPNREQIEKVRSWQPPAPRSTQIKNGLLLTGPSGVGKSRAFWNLVRRLLCWESRDVEVYTAARFFKELQAQVRYGTDESERWIQQRAKAEILAIDDFGQQAVVASRNDWSEACFFELLDLRMGHRRPTIITTNLTARQIAEQHDARSDPLLRRLLDACEVIKFTLPDHA